MNYGFVGTGNLGGAIARAVCKSVGGEFVLLANKTQAKAENLAEKMGCRVGSNKVAASCDFVFLGVKPHMMEDMLADIQDVLNPGAVLVTMSAGLTMDTIRRMAGGTYPVIRMMPITPSGIGEGLIQYCCDGISPELEQAFVEAMRYAGRLDKIDEKLIDAASCVSGCGPAWAYMFVESLADGGVACGLPRAAALEYAAQMLIGTGTMLLESGKHPGRLKDSVCSPGGSTIQGVRVLEEAGLRGAGMDAVIAAFEKNRDLGKK